MKTYKIQVSAVLDPSPDLQKLLEHARRQRVLRRLTSLAVLLVVVALCVVGDGAARAPLVALAAIMIVVDTATWFFTR